MKKVTERTLQNIEKFLLERDREFWGVLKGDVIGYYSRVSMNERSYFIHYVVLEEMNRLFIDVFIQAICEPPYRERLNAYLNQRTSTTNSGRWDLNPYNGEVNVRCETVMLDHAPSVATVKNLEMHAIHVADNLAKKIDRICHGVDFDEDDPALMGAFDRYLLEEFQLEKDKNGDKDKDESKNENKSESKNESRGKRNGGRSTAASARKTPTTVISSDIDHLLDRCRELFGLTDEEYEEILNAPDDTEDGDEDTDLDSDADGASDDDSASRDASKDTEGGKDGKKK